MSERLTDEELASLDRWAAEDLRGDDQRRIWAATDELRSLRASAVTLTEEDRRRIEFIIELGVSAHRERFGQLHATERALSVLTRLIGGGE